MKPFAWNERKNALLKVERGVSFEDVVFHIDHGNVLEVLAHPDQEKYPGQRVCIVEMDEYAYVVPFVESEAEVLLKTIIPGRKLTKRYLGG